MSSPDPYGQVIRYRLSDGERQGPAEVALRPRQPADLSTCAGLLLQAHLADGYPMAWPHDPAGWLAPAGLMAAWVAESAGQIVGHVALVEGGPVTDAGGDPGERWVEVAQLFVAPPARRVGVARSLLAVALRRAEAENRRAVLEVVDDAKGAVACYEQLGWRLFDRRPAEWMTADGYRPMVRRYAAP